MRIIGNYSHGSVWKVGGCIERKIKLATEFIRLIIYRVLIQAINFVLPESLLQNAWTSLIKEPELLTIDYIITYLRVPRIWSHKMPSTASHDSNGHLAPWLFESLFGCILFYFSDICWIEKIFSACRCQLRSLIHPTVALWTPCIWNISTLPKPWQYIYITRWQESDRMRSYSYIYIYISLCIYQLL